MTISTQVERTSRRRDLIAASSCLAVPLCAILATGLICCMYVFQNYAGKGEPFTWFDGTSSWPSIAIFLLAALLSVHFIVKIHFQLKQNAARLTEEFGLNDEISEESWRLTFKKIYRGWDPPQLVEIGVSHPGCEDEKEKKVDIEALWRSYLSRGRFWTRLSRATPMLILYLFALGFLLSLVGQFPVPPMRGSVYYVYFIQWLIISTIVLFLLLTFVVVDAVLLHEGFLKQLAWEKTHWPDRTFKKFKYLNKRKRPKNENSLADYWDILLIAKRTEAVGGLIYYPFAILSLLIVARLPYFGKWTWSPVVLVALTLHFSLALFAAWRLTKVAREYREEVLARLKRRRRQDLMLAQRLPEVTDTMIEEVQSTHQGAFSYLWEQPAIRALLLPSGGFGIVTLLQYLPH